MISSIFALVLVASGPVEWGACLQRTVVVSPAPTPPSPTPDPNVTPGPFRVDPPAVKPNPEPPKVSAPQVWTLTDASGQAWTHTDRDHLTRFVQARNASMVPYYQFGFGVGAYCPTGNCPR